MDTNKGKQYRILNEILFQYLPDFFPTKANKKNALAYPNAYNVEHLVELAMANVGGYKWVDAIGYDFDDKDKSDAKTCTLRKHDAQFTLNKIEHKIGSLRIVVYNEITDRLDYFYVTKVGRENRLEKGYLTKDRLQERMRSRYNIGRDDYCSFENFRCDSFKELATMTDKKMEKKNPKVKYLLSKSAMFATHFDEQLV